MSKMTREQTEPQFEHTTLLHDSETGTEKHECSDVWHEV